MYMYFKKTKQQKCILHHVAHLTNQLTEVNKWTLQWKYNDVPADWQNIDKIAEYFVM